MTTTLADLVHIPPFSGAGAQVLHGSAHWDVDFVWDESVWDGDVWVCVEMAVPSASATSLWDVAVWDEDVWGEPEWMDLTCWVQGVEWRRGGDPGEQPEPGELNIWLDNTAGQFVPWSPTPFTSPGYMGAGTLMRVSVHDSAGWWQPQITAVSTAWNRRRELVGEVHWVEVQGFDASSGLERVKDFAVAPVGAGDSVSQRFTRLLDAAGWQYGSTVGEVPAVTFQATTMEDTRLEELRMLGDAFDGRFSVGRDGRALIGREVERWVGDGVSHVVLSTREARYPKTGGEDAALWDVTEWDGPGTWSGDVWTASTLHIAYAADSMEEANDDEAIVTVVNVAATDGTEYVIEDATRRARYGRGFTVDRRGLPYQLSGQAAWGADLAARLLGRGGHTIRPVGCTVDVGWSPQALIAVANLDHNRLVNILSPDVAFTDARVAEVEHFLRLANGEMTWTVDLSFDVSDSYSWRPMP